MEEYLQRLSKSARSQFEHNLRHSYVEDHSLEENTEHTSLFNHIYHVDSTSNLTKSTEDADCYRNQHNKKHEAPTNKNTINSNLLQVETLLEANNFKDSTVHKLWGMIKLEVPSCSCPNTSPTSSPSLSSSLCEESENTLDVDFVVVIDHSSSMSNDNKLAFVQATIEYLLSKLSKQHRFCLIKFNKDVEVMTDGLLPMNSENKSKVLELLHEIKPEGTTNISDALFKAIKLLNDRKGHLQNRLSSIMLFTDGLANTGLQGKEFMSALQKTTIPVGLSLNTFGYGLDHDSNMLSNIALYSKQGVYYYIETVDYIAATFGECLAGILSTVVYDIKVRLIGQDGCRIVNFYTKSPVVENKSVKDYTISLGSMYKQETRSVLFRLSLRKMDEELLEQNLLKVEVSYTDTLNGKPITCETMCRVSRSKHQSPSDTMPIELDKYINRFTAASAIEAAINRGHHRDYEGAKNYIKDAILQVQKSVSFTNKQDSAINQYCEDLISDLVECAIGMEDQSSFHNGGVHYAYAYSTMYFTERSTGTNNLLGIGMVLNHLSCKLASEKKRNNGYGYLTDTQREESLRATKKANTFVTGYLENVL